MAISRLSATLVRLLAVVDVLDMYLSIKNQDYVNYGGTIASTSGLLLRLNLAPENDARLEYDVYTTPSD